MRNSLRDLQLLLATFVKLLKGAHQFALNHPNIFHPLGDPINIPITILLIHLHGVQGIVTIEIIDLALLGVTENIISLRNLLELCLSFFLRNMLMVVWMVLIWVPLHGQPLICPLEFFIRGIAVHLEDLVVISCTHFLFQIVCEKVCFFLFFSFFSFGVVGWRK